jgi:hypothetical protein
MFADGTSAVYSAAETSAHPAGRRLIGYATSTAWGRGMTACAVALEKPSDAPAPISRTTQVRLAAHGHCRARARRLSPPSKARKGPRIIASR